MSRGDANTENKALHLPGAVLLRGQTGVNRSEDISTRGKTDYGLFWDEIAKPDRYPPVVVTGKPSNPHEVPDVPIPGGEVREPDEGIPGAADEIQEDAKAIRSGVKKIKEIIDLKGINQETGQEIRTILDKFLKDLSALERQGKNRAASSDSYTGAGPGETGQGNHAGTRRSGPGGQG